MQIRIIPRLDIKGPNLVKGIHLEGLRVLGRPEVFAEEYYQAGADEFVFMDAVASLYGRNSLLDVIERTANHIFIPLTVGGGLTTVEDMEKVLHCGADKVAINTAAMNRPDLINEAAQRYGSSTIVVHIDAKRQKSGEWFAYTDNGRENSHRNAVNWAKESVERGAGEILVTSIDKEGTASGFDTNLVRIISEAVSVPVIACGGAGELTDIISVIRKGLADAVCLSSILHYGYVAQLIKSGFEFGNDGDFPIIHERRVFERVQPTSLQDVKSFLTQRGIPCRLSGNMMPRGRG